MVDTAAGLHPLDEEFANVLRKSKKPVYLVANKAETLERHNQAAEFYQLGFSLLKMKTTHNKGCNEFVFCNRNSSL